MPNVLQVQSPNIQNNPQIQNPSIRPETIHQPVNPERGRSEWRGRRVPADRCRRRRRQHKFRK